MYNSLLYIYLVIFETEKVAQYENRFPAKEKVPFRCMQSNYAQTPLSLF